MRVAFGIAVGTGVGMGVAVDATATIGVAIAPGVASSDSRSVVTGSRSVGPDPGRSSAGPRSHAESRANKVMAITQMSGRSRLGAGTIVTTSFYWRPAVGTNLNPIEWYQ